MAESLGDAVLALSTDDRGYTQGIGQAEAKAQTLGRTMTAASGSADRLTREIGRIRGSGSAFDAHIQSARAHVAALDDMRARFNPVFATIRQYQARLSDIRQAHSQGAISTNEMTAAIGRERQQALSSIAALKGRSTAHAQGANAARAHSAAYQQLGFQMQDVFQQAALGVNPMVIAAQQGGQMASAIALMGQNQSGTQSRMVRFATFLSGPWGAAVFGAATIIGFLVQGMLEADDAAKSAEDASFDFADGLDVLTLSAEQSSAAMRQLVQELKAAIATQGDFLRSSALVADQSVASLETRIAANSSELQRLERRRNGVLANILPSFAGPSADDRRRESELREQLQGDRRALTLAREASAAGAIALAQQRAIEANDPLAAARGEFQRGVAELNKRLQSTVENADDPLFAFNNPDQVITPEEYQREYTRLLQQREATEEAVRSSRRRNRRGRRGRSPEELAAMRDELDLEQEIAVAQARGDADTLRTLEREQQLRGKVERYMRAGLDLAQARTAAEKDMLELDEARAVARERARSEFEDEIDLQLAQVRGDHEHIRALEDQQFLKKRIVEYQELEYSLAEAQKRAQQDLLDLETARTEQAARRAADQQLAHEVELARLRGDREGAIRLEEEARRRDRAEQLRRDGMNEADAQAQAMRESLERDRAAQEGMFRDTFRAGVRAALTGDLKDFISRFFEDVMSRAADRFADALLDVLYSEQGGGGGGFVGSLLSIGTSLFGGGGSSAGSAAHGVGNSVGAGSTNSLKGFDTGGSFKFLGMPGVDRNVLSMNGTPIARVSRGEIAEIRRPGANEAGGEGRALRVVIEDVTGMFKARVEEITTPLAQREASSAVASYDRAMPGRFQNEMARRG